MSKLPGGFVGWVERPELALARDQERDTHHHPRINTVDGYRRPISREREIGVSTHPTTRTR